VSEYVNRANRLKKLRSEPKYLAGAWKHYETNPADFINDWGMTYDPRVKPSTIPFILYPRQRDYIDWLYARWQNREDGLCEKSRDAGATWLSGAFSAWLWIFHKGQSIGWGSRKEKLVDEVGNPDSIFEKIRYFIERLPTEFIPYGYNRKVHATYMKITNPVNGSIIAGEAGDNIGRGGRSSVYFKDESAFYERPQLIEAALSQNSDVKIDISTPNGNGNPFYRKRMGGQIDVFTFHWKDDPRKDEKWYLKQKRLLDPIVVAQEIDIDYDASIGDAFVSGEGVDDAMRNRPTDLHDDSIPVVLGVDIARFGDDRTAICCRQGRVVHWIETYQNLSTAEVEGIVHQLVRDMPRVDAIMIDIGAMGAGVYDHLKVHFDYAYGINFGSKSTIPECKNKRTEMWYNMREWFKDSPVSIPNMQDLKTDLCGLKYSIDSEGRYQLEKKDDAKKRGVKSPDLGDALALTFALPVSIATDYDYGYNSSNDGRSQTTGY